MSVIAAWTQLRVTISLGDGEVEEGKGWVLRAHSSDLAIIVREHEFESRWGVTHIETGRAVGQWFATRGAAEALLLAVQYLADWRLDLPQLLNLPELSAKVWQLRSDIYEREQRGDFGPVDTDTIERWNDQGRLQESQPTRELGVRAHQLVTLNSRRKRK